VTEIETWLRDPYAIYARHVLGLKALRLLEEPADAADYGSVVHAAVHAFLRDVGTRFPPDAEERLVAAMDAALEAQDLRPALAAWWRPRLRRIAAWLAGAERDRRLGSGLAHIASEKDGTWQVPAALPFTLVGRADRIERRLDDSIAILDYKTGMPPSAKDVAAGLAPQLPLEAAMAADGAFGPDIAGPASELTYWHLTGGYVPGEVTTLFRGDATKIDETVATARAKIAALVAAFDDPDRPYLSQPHPGQAPRFSDYTQLARVAEWAALDEGE
jgi:ATP-dependent helicase/nuclease subunit B